MHTMLIQLQMVHKNLNYFMVLAILLFATAVVSSEYRKSSEEMILSQLVNTATGEVDQDMAELLWVSCRLDLFHLEEGNKDLNFYFQEETSSSCSEIKGWSLTKEDVQKLMSNLHPQLKQTLLDCIRNNNLLFLVPGEDRGSDFWYTKYFDSLYSASFVSRRNLIQRIGHMSATDAAFAPSPEDPYSSEDGGSYNGSTSGSPVGKDKPGVQKAVIVAVVLTAFITFIVAALFFFCCTRMYQGGSMRRNDEKPLLSVTMSDYSVGSSHRSFGFGNSFTEEKHGQFGSQNLSHLKRPTLDNDLLIKSDALGVSLDETPSLAVPGSVESLDTSGKINPPLPLPPGRTGSNISPLKPPPGRAVPLPPEPPAALRLPPGRTGPPRPPPVISSTPNAALPPRPGLSPSPMASHSSPAPRPPPPGPPRPPGAAGAPSPPPPPSGVPGVPRPPPPPSGVPGVPRPPPPLGIGPRAPRPPVLRGPPTAAAEVGPSKTKLKPFFWDKVLTNPDNSMVWHQLKAGSFQFNEEMIETLFGYTATDKSKTDKKKDSAQDAVPQFVQILDHKKAQNLLILLKALNVTIEEVCDALREGNELPAEFLQTLLKMAPTTDEELKLRLFTGRPSDLGPAERFLKALVDIPFSFKRMESLLFMCTLEEDVAQTKESFQTLEIACKELRSSRLFLKLLEAVLKTGNRMNDGTFRGGAQAFKLDTLLKLSDVKGTDGKTTLLHFVVQEIIRSEGVRAARTAKQSQSQGQSFSALSVMTEDLLKEISPDTEEHYRGLGLQVVSCLSSELDNVKKAAHIDADSLKGTVAKLNYSLLKAREFLNKDMSSLEEDSGFHEALKSFVQTAEVNVTALLEEEKRIMGLVKRTGDYFHGNTGKDEGLRLFSIVRDFLVMLEKVCNELREAQKKAAQNALKKESSTASSSSDVRSRPTTPDLRAKLFPAIVDRRMNDSDSSSSDSSDSDPG